ncbi:MAG: dihydroneopterin aldolase [Ignavibacteriaceae bacterium]|jgi:7,8-dihydroneopterin aldolase/epimerase/oxygenase|nr:dihydroneopterin aldolase [Ignavibacteriaceae bacterium]MCW9065980.1 dihydroneopterin aldolase [Ignavibacteriaceae bacterium]
MINIIRIKNATFYGYHGVSNEEQYIGGQFEADIDIHTDFSAAAANDDLTKTVDYYQVYSFLNQFTVSRKYFLIEALAIEIANELLKKFEGIIKVAVRVRKNNPPLGGVVDCVEAEVIKERKELNN